MSALIFYLVLAVVLFAEGSGLPAGREVAYLIIILSSPLFLLARRRPTKLPARITPMITLFLVLSFISILFSQNVKTSILLFLFYISCFSVFVFAYSIRNELKKFMPTFLLIFGFIFSIYSLVVSFFASRIPQIVPHEGYQLVYSYTSSHNHLGDYLLLPLIVCFYYLFSNRPKSPKNNLLSIIYNLCILFFLPYFLFSYSRSAYVALTGVLLIMLINFYRTRMMKISSARIGITLIVLVLSGLFMFSVVRSGTNTRFSQVTKVLVEKNALSFKDPYGSRIDYLREGILSAIEKPLFGVGPGNFYLASIKYTKVPGLWTHTAHNIFLEILVENGILAGAVFVLIIFELLRRSEKNLFFFLALALLLNFQTDYTYRIYSLFLLFFVLLGIIYKEKSAV